MIVRGLMPVNRHDASHFRKSNWSATPNQFTPTNGGMHRCGYRYKLLATVPVTVAGNGTKLAPKKLFRTLARVIPQCGMASQAVAFNMFLAFFPNRLVALS
jgi:hypothetical protein